MVARAGHIAIIVPDFAALADPPLAASASTSIAASTNGPTARIPRRATFFYTGFWS